VRASSLYQLASLPSSGVSSLALSRKPRFGASPRAHACTSALTSNVSQPAALPAARVTLGGVAGEAS
jgi:hypothetical protein